MNDKPQNLEALIRAAGEDWLLDWHIPREQAIPHIQSALEHADREMRSRFPGEGIDEQRLIAVFERSPHKVKAFLQALGETDSPQMLVMAWRLLQGMEVAQVEMRYRHKEQFSLRVKLIEHAGVGEEAYESQNINDAAVFRHLGVMKVNDHPVFDGFFALQR